MPHQTGAPSTREQRNSKAQHARRLLAGSTIPREDSDDELGDEDQPWAWIFEDEAGNSQEGEADANADDSTTRGRRSRLSRNASKSQGSKIVGARMGTFECQIGDCVLLKADNNEAWVGIICSFSEEEEMGATVMCMGSTEWFLAKIQSNLL